MEVVSVYDKNKIEKLAAILECTPRTIYNILSGSFATSYKRAKALDSVLGGGIALWKEKGGGGEKRYIFANAEL